MQEYGISLKRYAVFCVCGYKCSASSAIIKDYNQISVYLQTNRLALTKAPLCKGNCREATEGLYNDEFSPFTIPLSRFACYLLEGKQRTFDMPMSKGAFALLLAKVLLSLIQSVVVRKIDKP